MGPLSNNERIEGARMHALKTSRLVLSELNQVMGMVLDDWPDSKALNRTCHGLSHIHACIFELREDFEKRRKEALEHERDSE